MTHHSGHLPTTPGTVSWVAVYTHVNDVKKKTYRTGFFEKREVIMRVTNGHARHTCYTGFVLNSIVKVTRK